MGSSFFYPGLGLGIIACKAKRVTDSMIAAGIDALAAVAPILEDPYGSLMPTLTDARAVSRSIALAVYRQAHADGVATHGAPEEAERRVDFNTWEPAYVPIKLVPEREPAVT